jgi:ribosomal protein S13
MPQAKLSGRQNLAAFDFPNGALVLTEAGSKRRASLHVLVGEESLSSVDPGGIDVLGSDLASFRAALVAENRTLKRALTDPRMVSGIGNAYSDEILHAAELSPIALTQKLTGRDWEKLFAAARYTLMLWIDRLRAEAQKSFPEGVTSKSSNAPPAPRKQRKARRNGARKNGLGTVARSLTLATCSAPLPGEAFDKATATSVVPGGPASQLAEKCAWNSECRDRRQRRSANTNAWHSSERPYPSQGRQAQRGGRGSARLQPLSAAFRSCRT